MLAESALSSVSTAASRSELMCSMAAHVALITVGDREGERQIPITLSNRRAGLARRTSYQRSPPLLQPISEIRHRMPGRTQLPPAERDIGLNDLFGMPDQQQAASFTHGVRLLSRGSTGPDGAGPVHRDSPPAIPAVVHTRSPFPAGTQAQ